MGFLGFSIAVEDDANSRNGNDRIVFLREKNTEKNAQLNLISAFAWPVKMSYSRIPPSVSIFP